MVIGNDRITSIGLTIKFSKEKTAAAIKADCQLEMLNPLKKPAKAKKISVLAKIFCHHFIS